MSEGRTFEAERPIASTDINFHIGGIGVSRWLRPSSRVGKTFREGSLLTSMGKPVTLNIAPSKLSLLLARINIDTTAGRIESHLMPTEGRSDSFKQRRRCYIMVSVLTYVARMNVITCFHGLEIELQRERLKKD